MTRDQRRLTAIVSADVVGYSRLMGGDESGTLAALKGHLRELIEPKVAEYGGRTVKTMGDGLLLEFPSVVDAVRCAVDVQRGMAERNAGLPDEKQIQFRVGINVGDIIIDGDDIFGDGVNVAARLQTLALPGGICVSRGVRDQVLDKLSFTFEDMGAQEVKNIARPIEVYRIRDEPLGGLVIPRPGAPGPRPYRVGAGRGAPWRLGLAGAAVLGLAGIAVWMFLPVLKAPSAASPPPLSVAIMPFTATGNAVESQAAEALRRDLVTGLGAIAHELKTVQVNAVGDGAVNPIEIGRQLNVRYVAEGDVQRDAVERIVSLRLVDVRTGGQIGGERYSFPDVSTVETSIKVRKMVGFVWSTVAEADTRHVMAQPLDRLNATELMLRGDFLRSQASAIADFRKARDLYDAALRLDPNLVAALVRRSDILDQEIDVDPNPDRDRVAREMDVYSSRALQLDPASPEVWRARSVALADAHRWDAAIEAINRAIKLDPYSANPQIYKAVWMNFSGRPTDALSIVDQAMSLKPEYSAWGMLVACWAHLFLGQPDLAIATCERAAPQEPNWLVTVLLSAAYANRGDIEKAVAMKDRALQKLPGFTIAQLRAKRYSEVPEYLRLAETYWYPGLQKAGFPER